MANEYNEEFAKYQRVIADHQALMIGADDEDIEVQDGQGDDITRPSFQKYLKRLFEENSAELNALVAGRMTFETLEELNAVTSPTIPTEQTTVAAEVLNDTDNNSGLYVWDVSASEWVKSPYGYTQEVSYVDGNLVGDTTKTVDGYGLNNSYAWTASGNYGSTILKVDEGDELYISNEHEDYLVSSGYAYAFFDADPSNGAASRVVDVRQGKTDVATGLAYSKTTVPDGAVYLVFNSYFVNAVQWAIHLGGFSNDYTQGTSVIESINGSVVLTSSNKKTLKDLGLGNIQTGDLVSSEEVYSGKFLTQSGVLSQKTEWSAIRFDVTPGDVIYAKINSTLDYPFKAAYSDSTTDLASANYIADAEFVATDTSGVYKLTVPNTATVVSVFMNYILNTDGNTLDLSSDLSIQKYGYSSASEGVSGTGISEVSGIPLIDTYARTLAASSSSRLSDTKVMAFGDSITAGTEGGYVKYLSGAFNTTVENHGSSGARANRVVDILTAGDGLPRRDSATAAIAWPTLDFTDLKLVTLMIGTNDSVGSVFGDIATIPTSQLSDAASEADYWALFPNDYVGNICLFIEYLKNKSPDVEIYLIRPIHDHDDSGISITEKVIPYLDDISQLYAVPLVNAIYESGLSFKLMKDTYSYDGGHLNALGNKVFGNYLAREILK